MSDSTPLPSAPAVAVSPGIILQPPLSRCGRGPGLVLVRAASHAESQANNHSLDPEPVQKWAEESFAIAQITFDSESSGSPSSVFDLLRDAVQALTSLTECDKKDSFGLLGLSRPNYSSEIPVNRCSIRLPSRLRAGIRRSSLRCSSI